MASTGRHGFHQDAAAPIHMPPGGLHTNVNKNNTGRVLLQITDYLFNTEISHVFQLMSPTLTASDYFQ